MEELSEKLESGDKDAIESAIKALEEIIKGDDKVGIERKSKALSEASDQDGRKALCSTRGPAG